MKDLLRICRQAKLTWQNYRIRPLAPMTTNLIKNSSMPHLQLLFSRSYHSTYRRLLLFFWQFSPICQAMWSTTGLPCLIERSEPCWFNPSYLTKKSWSARKYQKSCITRVVARHQICQGRRGNRPSSRELETQAHYIVKTSFNKLATHLRIHFPLETSMLVVCRSLAVAGFSSKTEAEPKLPQTRPLRIHRAIWRAKSTWMTWNTLWWSPPQFRLKWLSLRLCKWSN